MKFRILILACALLTACATTPDRSSRYCGSDNFHVDARFEGGSFYRCEFNSADSVKIIIEAEDEKYYLFI